MSKFKVGDRVANREDGAVGTVVGFSGNMFIVDYEDPWPAKLYEFAANLSLVPAAPSPVITKTVKEIVPGEFGPVSVRRYDRDGADHVRVSLFHSDEMYRALDASELREAARIFNELADALDDQ